MEVKTSVDGTHAAIEIEGKMTVETSPKLEAVVDKLDTSICDIDVFLSGVSYVSSAGLRALVSADQTAVRRGGVMCVLYPRDEIMDLFEITGLSEVLKIVR